jgi:hypothetical protein
MLIALSALTPSKNFGSDSILKVTLNMNARIVLP